jgi:hypothetical protein
MRAAHAQARAGAEAPGRLPTRIGLPGGHEGGAGQLVTSEEPLRSVPWLYELKVLLADIPPLRCALTSNLSDEKTVCACDPCRTFHGIRRVLHSLSRSLTDAKKLDAELDRLCGSLIATEAERDLLRKTLENASEEIGRLRLEVHRATDEISLHVEIIDLKKRLAESESRARLAEALAK